MKLNTESRLDLLAWGWRDEPAVHLEIATYFTEWTNVDPLLKEHRDWVEANAHGYGERAFHGMWGFLLKEYSWTKINPSNSVRFTFLEIGVFKGQVLSLVDLISYKVIKHSPWFDWDIYGITPLDSSGGHVDTNYMDCIDKIHRRFNTAYFDELRQPRLPKLFVGLSTSPDIINKVSEKFKLPGIDILYIDGGHDFDTVTSDIKNYVPLVNPGGLLVIDDSANKLHLPAGFFLGIESVSDATDQLLMPFCENPIYPFNEFEFLFNVGHNRIWRRRLATK